MALRKIAEGIEIRGITGDLMHDPEHHYLELDDHDEYEPPERLTINLEAYGLFPASPEEVFVKDWSEGSGVTQALGEAGVAEIVGEVRVGPFDSTAYRLRMIPQS